jgi:hypothetical protein
MIEEVVSGIWTEVLGSTAGCERNFFEAGGHSLLATQVISRISGSFQVQMPLRVIFENPTITGLSRQVEDHLRKSAGVGVPPIQRADRRQPIPLSFAQQRLWVLDQMRPGSSFYNVPVAVRLDGHLVLAALQASLDTMIRRHEALRTGIENREEQRVQVIHDLAHVELAVCDVVQGEEDVETKVHRICREEAAMPFNLAQPPLWRAKLLRISENRHLLVMVFHHIVIDAWSIGIFVREVSLLYRAALEGVPSPLHELPIQYPDFSYWQHNNFPEELLQKQLRYWKEQLAGLPELFLPGDSATQSGPTKAGGKHIISAFPDGITEAVACLSRHEGVSLFVTLLTAFSILLHWLTGQSDIAIGVPLANRNRAETEQLIGFFVNETVLRVNVVAKSAFRDLLRQVHHATIGAHMNQDVSFDDVVAVVRPRRNQGRNPLVRVQFDLHNTEMPALVLPELTLTPMEIDRDDVQFDLQIALWSAERRMAILAGYNTGLFTKAGIEQLLQNYYAILTEAVEDSQRRVSEFLKTQKGIAEPSHYEDSVPQFEF